MSDHLLTTRIPPLDVIHIHVVGGHVDLRDPPQVRPPISDDSCATHPMHHRNVPPVGVTAARAESPFGVVTMSVHKLNAGSGR
jgi:hypothetical protein